MARCGHRSKLHVPRHRSPRKFLQCRISTLLSQLPYHRKRPFDILSMEQHLGESANTATNILKYVSIGDSWGVPPPYAAMLRRNAVCTFESCLIASDKMFRFEKLRIFSLEISTKFSKHCITQCLNGRSTEYIGM